MAFLLTHEPRLLSVLILAAKARAGRRTIEFYVFSLKQRIACYALA
jgi:hypothetical protein